MELIVLGNNGPFPGAGGACSGYLLSDGNTRILLDCGNGVLSNLQKFIELEKLDAIILSHMHSDHISDMMVLRYVVQIKKSRGQIDRVFDVFAPEEPAEEFKRLNTDGIFNLKPINSGLKLSYGKFNITFSEMKHPVKCFAIAIESTDKRFVYSGDTSWNEGIIEFSRDSDMLLIDAGLLSSDKKNDKAPHLTARECGIIAARSGAKKLLLTHFWPEYDINQLILEAREAFPGAEPAILLEKYVI